MSRFAGIAALVVVLALVLLFTRWNGAERMTLDLGVHTFYRVPTVWVVFIAFLLGMTVMLLTGLHADLKVRRYLRDRLNREDQDPAPIPPVDRLQQDLFTASQSSVPPALPASALRELPRETPPSPAAGVEGDPAPPASPLPPPASPLPPPAAQDPPPTPEPRAP